VIKAIVKRDGPEEWRFSIVDDRGEIVAGLSRSWADAYRAATAELEELDAGEPADPGVVIRGRWSTVIPGDATVPPGDRLFHRDGPTFHELIRSRVPAWRRWLGL
jgi:hypothetical protein